MQTLILSIQYDFEWIYQSNIKSMKYILLLKNMHSKFS